MLMKGKFTRLSPANFSENMDMPRGWFAISHLWMTNKRQRKLNHGKWFKIKSSKGQVYRILRFSVDLAGDLNEGKGQIVVDWQGWLQLWDYAEDVSGEIDLTISKIGWWQYPRVFIAHPDPTYRLAAELRLLSVLLGIMSVILALLAI